jgi:hypothetical protein
VGVNKKTVDKKLCSYKRKEKNSQRALNQKWERTNKEVVQIGKGLWNKKALNKRT